MKLYKLKVTGNDESFNVEYNFSDNFVDYSNFNFTGSEQEKYDKFLEDLQGDGGFQPINVKVKMTTKNVDRAISRKEVLEIKEVEKFIKRLGE
ncbi:MAG: hypothetical protein MJA82_16150 [Clostridia bacterium]|nr:hypothetical protein [Clostridia bacterium]